MSEISDQHLKVSCEYSEQALSKQKKECGHFCYPSSTTKCCPCSDIRPHLKEGKYPMYVDGEGWKDGAIRNAFYCHICNPKNYSEWEKRIQKEREINILYKLHVEHKQTLEKQVFEQDKQRAAKICEIMEENLNDSIQFKYSNNDIYNGNMSNGLKHGVGTIDYSDGSTYTGNWINDKKCGYGVMNWGDGIEYVGEWDKDMMNGKGKYTMTDGTTFAGNFIDDEIS